MSPFFFFFLFSVNGGLNLDGLTNLKKKALILLFYVFFGVGPFFEGKNFFPQRGFGFCFWGLWLFFKFYKFSPFEISPFTKGGNVFFVALAIFL